jgi:hypothetical protein
LYFDDQQKHWVCIKTNIYLENINNFICFLCREALDLKELRENKANLDQQDLWVPEELQDQRVPRVTLVPQASLEALVSLVLQVLRVSLASLEMMASLETLDQLEILVREEKWDCKVLQENRFDSVLFE